MKDVKKMTGFTAAGILREVRKQVKVLSAEECRDYRTKKVAYVDCVRPKDPENICWKPSIREFAIRKYAGEEPVGELYNAGSEQFFFREDALEALVQFFAEPQTPISPEAWKRMRRICEEIRGIWSKAEAEIEAEEHAKEEERISNYEKTYEIDICLDEMAERRLSW